MAKVRQDAFGDGDAAIVKDKQVRAAPYGLWLVARLTLGRGAPLYRTLCCAQAEVRKALLKSTHTQAAGGQGAPAVRAGAGGVGVGAGSTQAVQPHRNGVGKTNVSATTGPSRRSGRKSAPPRRLPV